jgi:lipoate-protein ligase A
VSIVKVLPELAAGGDAQMALDVGLLQTADAVFARRYTWSTPTLSLGKFQRVELLAELPFDVVRRPSGGRAVLHGEAFEWSFAVVFPVATLTTAARPSLDIDRPYDIVAAAFEGALQDLGVDLDERREAPYQRSALCFASALRHDLISRGEKVVALAQARGSDRVLVHGSLLERRPPERLTRAVEAVMGEAWQGDGLGGALSTAQRAALWSGVLCRVEARLRELAPLPPRQAAAAATPHDEST